MLVGKSGHKAPLAFAFSNPAVAPRRTWWLGVLWQQEMPQQRQPYPRSDNQRGITRTPPLSVHLSYVSLAAEHLCDALLRHSGLQCVWGRQGLRGVQAFGHTELQWGFTSGTEECEVALRSVKWH